MSIIKRILLSFFALVFIVGFVSCGNQGPMEKAGKKADQTVKDVQKAVKKKTE
jgi:predicted small lipoprotein YifL